MDAVADGRVKITPDRYAKGYHDWLSEKRDWPMVGSCGGGIGFQDWLGEKSDWPIGRQLWWGHRIPVWTRRFNQ